MTNYKIVVISRNKTIRTNRTGGEFEKEMDKQITEIGKIFTFDTPQYFSYHPEYKIQEMDILWEK